MSDGWGFLKMYRISSLACVRETINSTLPRQSNLIMHISEIIAFSLKIPVRNQFSSEFNGEKNQSLYKLFYQI